MMLEIERYIKKMSIETLIDQKIIMGYYSSFLTSYPEVENRLKSEFINEEYHLIINDLHQILSTTLNLRMINLSTLISSIYEKAKLNDFETLLADIKSITNEVQSLNQQFQLFSEPD